MINPRVDITVVILTRNEESNIAKSLTGLCWASKVLVVDSFSTDGTKDIADSFANVQFVTNAFLSHAQQWNFAVNHSDIVSSWVLCLDADYEVPPDCVIEFGSLAIDEDVDAISCGFDYRINGQSVGANVYGRKPVLFRRGRVEFVQQGHTQIPVVAGRELSIASSLIHDDRKSTRSWLLSQQRYAELEAQHLHLTTSTRRIAGNIRRWPRVSVFAVFCYLVIVKGMLFKGRAGYIYLLQRLIAESLISMRVIDHSPVDANSLASNNPDHLATAIDSVARRAPSRMLLGWPKDLVRRNWQGFNQEFKREIGRRISRVGNQNNSTVTDQSIHNTSHTRVSVRASSESAKDLDISNLR